MTNNFKTPKCFALTVEVGSVYADNAVVLPTGFATNTLYLESSGNCQVRLNGDDEAVFLVVEGWYTFDRLSITSIEFANADSGAGDVDIQVIVGLIPLELA
jgi:hypothetical protein